MKEEKNHIHYSSEDIRKYLEGKMSGPEMQSLEKAALEDPFLADAIEGFEESMNHPVSFESGIADLQNRLSARIKKSKRKNGLLLFFPQWKVAVSILFIMGLTIFSYKYLVNKPTAELSKKTEEVRTKGISPPAAASQQTDTFPRATISSPAKTASDTAGNALNQQPAEGETKSSPRIVPRERKIEQKDAEKLETESLRVTDAEPGPVQADDLVVARKKSILMQPEEKTAGISISSDKDLRENYIQGVVVDKKGKPIPYAAVKIRGSKKGTFTDTSGFFKLYMKDPRLAALIFSHPPGYESTSVELIPDSTVTNTIEMQPASVASNKVVSLELNKQKEEAGNAGYYQSDSIQDIRNLIGWDVFIGYINTHKKITTADSLLRGEEILSFILYKDGKLSSFKFEKSISPAHDAEILQLIRTAPSLKLKTGKKQRCRVNIFF